MKLYIKNMVCRRCKMAVKSELEKLGLNPISVELGEVEIKEANIDDQKGKLVENLKSIGFDLLNTKNSQTIERIKNLIVDLVHNKNNELTGNLSDYLSSHLLQDYNAMSNLFSDVEQITIEKYFILQKIEKVKELLVYDEMTLSEIALQMNYSSVGHLSNQFKKTIGFSPSHFKKMKNRKRKQIEDL